MTIAATAILFPNVKLGNNVTIEDFVIIGAPPRGAKPGELETVIGDNAHIRSHSVIYAGNILGEEFACGHQAFLRESNKVGNHVSIGTGSIIEHHVTIGNNVRIHSHVFIPEFSELHDDCWIGPNVVLTNAKHPKCPKVKHCLKGATIGRFAIIGANSTLVPDIVIGERSLVGAGSVVVGDVEPETVVAGNPARFIKKIADLDCPYEMMEKPYP
jgi:acetyltransferase-like isoleucine patch superfamily enzyme